VTPEKQPTPPPYAQLAPLVHGVHVPWTQTWFTPHVVPSGATTPVATHTGAPVEHEVAPGRHGSPESQALPAEHATQPPWLHTLDRPQLVPLGAGMPVSTHAGRPPEQSMAPALQGLSAGVQGAPAAQSTHAPRTHTLPAPHAVPSGTLPVGLHALAPVPLQKSVPSTQAFPGNAHGSPALAQRPHEPPRHVAPFPHGVPSGAFDA
jgi:hypothetical protein